MMETIMHYGQSGYALHAFVIMPDHLHLLITPSGTLERAVQLLKGGFSFRARKEFDWHGEIWQPSFTDHRIRDEEDWNRHLHYIRSNPLEAKLARESSSYVFMGFPNPHFPQGLKPPSLSKDVDVRAEARTLHSNSRTAEAVPFQSIKE
jgi:putative transposase